MDGYNPGKVHTGSTTEKARVVGKTSDLPITQKLLDRIVQSPQQVIALETANGAEIVAHMRTLAMRGGTSVYAWTAENGIASLRESGLNVAGSRRLGDALRYVLQSMHFGVYLFVDSAPLLRPVDTLLLRRISRLQALNERKLVFIGQRVELPEELDGMFERLSIETENQLHLRLRDGHWVQ